MGNNREKIELGKSRKRKLYVIDKLKQNSSKLNFLVKMRYKNVQLFEVKIAE